MEAHLVLMKIKFSQNRLEEFRTSHIFSSMGIEERLVFTRHFKHTTLL